MIFNVYEWPSKRLSKVANLIDVDNPDEKEEAADLVNSLFQTMNHYNGIGLAATQCGIEKSIFVMDTTTIHDKGIQQSFINPVIIDVRGETLYKEGCLSFPNVYANVERHEIITIAYWDIDLDKIVQTQLSGIESICFQHELDHLNGVVFVDYLSPLKRKLVLRKLKKRIKT